MPRSGTPSPTSACRWRSRPGSRRQRPPACSVSATSVPSSPAGGRTWWSSTRSSRSWRSWHEGRGWRGRRDGRHGDPQRRAGRDLRRRGARPARHPPRARSPHAVGREGRECRPGARPARPGRGGHRPGRWPHRHPDPRGSRRLRAARRPSADQRGEPADAGDRVASGRQRHAPERARPARSRGGVDTLPGPLRPPARGGAGGRARRQPASRRAYQRLCRARPSRTRPPASRLVDAEGDALHAALVAAPDVVKPNAAELRATTGHDDPALGAEALLRAGARAVVVSLGPDGLLAVTDAESWQAIPPEVVLGNPTGAGDATMAALAAGLAGGHPWSETLREAVAVAAAAVLLPVAGGFDPTAYRRFHDAVTVRPLYR